MAGATGLEPATSGSTVRSSNQLSYSPKKRGMKNNATQKLAPYEERYSIRRNKLSQAKIRIKKDSPPLRHAALDGCVIWRKSAGGSVRQRFADRSAALLGGEPLP